MKQFNSGKIEIICETFKGNTIKQFNSGKIEVICENF